jgi:hypothetical protein
MQLTREIPANKSKKNQMNPGKSLAFSWIPLAEMGLFNGLQRIQIKKSSAAESGTPSCIESPPLSTTWAIAP